MLKRTGRRVTYCHLLSFLFSVFTFLHALHLQGLPFSSPSFFRSKLKETGRQGTYCLSLLFSFIFFYTFLARAFLPSLGLASTYLVVHFSFYSILWFSFLFFHVYFHPGFFPYSGRIFSLPFFVSPFSFFFSFLVSIPVWFYSCYTTSVFHCLWLIISLSFLSFLFIKFRFYFSFPFPFYTSSTTPLLPCSELIFNLPYFLFCFLYLFFFVCFLFLYLLSLTLFVFILLFSLPFT